MAGESPVEKVDRDKLSEEGWKLLKQALTEGQMVLPNGDVRPLKAAEIAKVAQWVAGLSAFRKRKAMATPDEFLLKKTSG